MKTAKSAIVAGVSLIALTGTLSMGLNAQQTGFTRTVLQKGDI